MANPNQPPPIPITLHLHPSVYRKLRQLVYLIGLRRGQDLTPEVIVKMGLQKLWDLMSDDELALIDRPAWRNPK